MTKAAPLLMLPGLMCDDSIFTRQSEAFEGAVAVSGYGLADSLTDMARTALARAPSRFSLLGHSMGARVALEIVRLAPERVARLALLSTGIHPPRPGEAETRFALRDLGRAQGMAALVDAWLPPMVAPERQHDESLMAFLRHMAISAGIEAFEAQITALLHRPALDALLPGIACPTLVAAGSLDIWSPPAQHEQIARAIPGASLRIVPGAGHMLPAEAPEALNPILNDWLNHST